MSGDPDGGWMVADRVYSEPDEFGHRRLLHAKGARIRWDEADRLGLTASGLVPDRKPAPAPTRRDAIFGAMSTEIEPRRPLLTRDKEQF